MRMRTRREGSGGWIQGEIVIEIPRRFVTGNMRKEVYGVME
jgi:hypothetical protein